jgi:hypothetical protein
MNRRGTKGNTLRIVCGWIWPARSVKSVEDLVGAEERRPAAAVPGDQREEEEAQAGAARAPHRHVWRRSEGCHTKGLV